MRNILLFDGTRDPRFGLAMKPALSEIEKYLTLNVSPEPGSTDLDGYNFIKDLEAASFNPQRDQCDIDFFTRAAMRCFDRSGFPAIDTILLTEKDFYRPGLNWCFGYAVDDTADRKYVVLSVARMKDPKLLTHVLTHEMGHAYGAARQGRSNTEENLGSHCTNTCVMQQKLTVEAMMEYAKILAARRDKFCGQCADEIKNYR